MRFDTLPKILFYSASFCAFYFICTELMLNTLVWSQEAAGYTVMWLAVPLALLFTAAVVVTDRVSIPRLLLKGRYGAFVALTFAIAYVVLSFSLLFESWICSRYGVESRVNDWSSPWIIVERFCTSISLTLILLGIGCFRLFGIWRVETEREEAMGETLAEYIRVVRNRLDPRRIMESLDILMERLSGSYEEFTESLNALSDYLRNQLYELPAPPEAERVEGFNERQRMADFMVGRSKRWVRWLLFEGILFFISFASCLIYPDRPDLSPTAFFYLLCVFAGLNLIAGLNRLFFIRRFPKHRSVVRYFVELTLLILLLTGTFLVVAISTKESPERTFEPFWILTVAMVGSVLNLVLFTGGLSALFMFRHWIEGRRRMAVLSAETTRQEYLFLKKQINPHFLFNILNGIGILAEEDREEARKMLEELRRLMEYQFKEAASDTTDIDEEIRFLESYIALERMRSDSIRIEFHYSVADTAARIPTLLFIPIVENAVKHSAGVIGERKVEVTIKGERAELHFTCRNRFSPDLRALRPASRAGGLGLANLRRRLSLLYSDPSLLHIKESEEWYTVILRLPLG